MSSSLSFRINNLFPSFSLCKVFPVLSNVDKSEEILVFSLTSSCSCPYSTEESNMEPPAFASQAQTLLGLHQQWGWQGLHSGVESIHCGLSNSSPLSSHNKQILCITLSLNLQHYILIIYLFSLTQQQLNSPGRAVPLSQKETWPWSSEGQVLFQSLCIAGATHTWLVLS